MAAFAIYRLPYADHAVIMRQTVDDPEPLHSCLELNGRQGFVLAPFQVTDSQPIWLIRPDEVQEIPLQDHCSMFDHQRSMINPEHSMVLGGHSSFNDQSLSRRRYAIDFANFHAQLQQGAFRKIVLSRCVDETVEPTSDPQELFWRACACYPRLFVAMVSLPQTGIWLTATPEILLDGGGDRWRTVALAGTMRLENDSLQGEGEDVRWSPKNIQEQRYVATYMAECLEQFTTDFHEEGPNTVRAANLVHLRSDFDFSLSDTSRLGDLLHALHPTPAVCGLPKRAAFDFIIRNEAQSRQYYSGFMGPLAPASETHLYVSLRCMHIQNGYHLYAGGGLLKDSIEEQEWLETEAKLETMRKIL